MSKKCGFQNRLFRNKVNATGNFDIGGQEFTTWHCAKKQ